MQEHKEWLMFAEADLKMARILLNSEEDLVIGGVLYHCQQSVEKSLKAYLVYKDQEVLKVHDLVKLIYRCGKIDEGFFDFLSYAAEMNPYATKTRYPDSLFFIPTVSVAEWAVQQTAKIFDFVENKID